MDDEEAEERWAALLNRTYVDARYSPHYEITSEELAWLVERVSALQESVAAICAERLESTGASQPDA